MAHILYILAMLIAYYLLPMLIVDTGMGILVLLLAIPIIIFASAFLYGRFRGFSFFITIATPTFFVPAVFIFFNETATVYVAIYTVVAILGNILGEVFHKRM